MDRQQWAFVARCLAEVARALPRTKRVRYADRLIVSMYLWAVAHDRPLCWACDRAHYGGVYRPRGPLPSVSQFGRRVKAEPVRRLLQLLHARLAGPLTLAALSYLDGKPLPVGTTSRDPEARRGHVCGGLAKGYKLHAIVTEGRRIATWCVRPLNAYEPHVAAEMLDAGVRFTGRALLLADGNYDDHDFHKCVGRHGGRLLSEPRGMATHPVTLRQMGPARREALTAWRATPATCRFVYKRRIAVESTFAGLTGYGGGLQPLPSFVRRLPRVTRWVGAKIILYHARLAVRRARETER